MKKFLIDDFIAGVSKGGMACGPVGGHVVAELRLINTEDNTVTYHGLSEVEGTLNFTESDVSTYKIQIEEDFENQDAWNIVEAAYAGGYSDYDEFYDDLKTCDEDHRLIWKLLAYLVRASWEEYDRMKFSFPGKYLSEIEIPVCDAEQEYLANHEEEDPMEDIQDEYIGQAVNISLFDFQEGDTPEGGYSFEETVQEQDGNEYKCAFGFDLDDDGIIKYIPRIRCKKRQDDGTFTDTDFIPAEAYERLRNELDSMM